jgi:murein DD-endopeptidase MepM/ murein hydrolase activator NlpD
MSAEQQRAVEDWHFSDIDRQAEARGINRYIGQTIAGVPINQNSIRAMAHIGGIGGVRRFIMTGGRVDSGDPLGTKISDYGRLFNRMPSNVANSGAANSGRLSVNTRGAGQGRISSHFGMRIHPRTGRQRMHEGMDIVAGQGTIVAAAYDGEVIGVTRSNSGYGNSIRIRHTGGSIRYTRYSHLHSIGVSENMRVTAGDVIGTVGSTGNSTGNHLHYEEMDRNGDQRDPRANYAARRWIVGGTPNAAALVPQPVQRAAATRTPAYTGRGSDMLNLYSAPASTPAPSPFTGLATFNGVLLGY